MNNRMKEFSPRELSDFTGHLSMILQSGISLPEGLSMMEEDWEGAEEKKLFSLLQEKLEESSEFSEALCAAGGFPDYMVKMVKLGQESGHLDDVMEALSQHYDREDSLQKSIRSAIAYPVAMLLMMGLVVVLLLTQVMPIFNGVYQQLGSSLTGFSQGLLTLGLGLRRYGALLAAAVLLLLVLLLCLQKKRGGFGRLGKVIPWAGKLQQLISLTRFCSGMYLTLSSGLHPEYALELTEDLMEDPAFLQQLEISKKKLDDGEELSQALLHAGIFSGVYARMVSIGQKTGTMDDALLKIAEDSQDRVDQKISGALSLIEPCLVVILSLIVGVILLSVMLPLLGLLTGI